MCGKEAPLYKAKVEGSVLDVCEGCARFGEVIRAPQRRHAEAPQRRPMPIPKRKEIIQVITDDYANKVRTARERMGLTQEEFSKRLNERWSEMQKIESGKMKPSIETARKLEKLLGISIVEEHGEGGDIPIENEKPNKNEFTLGDFIKTKKK
jgi:putative transcription factor